MSKLWPILDLLQVSYKITFLSFCQRFYYCKRCYFRVTIFSRLAAQKHIRGLLNSRWADAHLSFWYCKYFRGFLNSRLLNLREIREN